MVRLTVSPDFPELKRRFWRQVNQEFNQALEDGRRDAISISPIGVSPLGESLRGNWVVEPIQLLENNRGAIVNRSEDALSRVVGSPPGTFVDPRRGGPLFRWAASKGIPARAVARSILARGTQRWRTGENPFGLDRSGEWRDPESGLAGRITQDIRRRIMRLRF